MIGAMLKNRNGTAEARGQRAVIRDQWSVSGEGGGSGGGRGGRGCAPGGRDGGAGVSAQGNRRGRCGRAGVRQRTQGAARSPGATQERRPGGAGVCGTSTNPSEHWVRVPVQPAAGVNMGLDMDCTNCRRVLGKIRENPCNQCLPRKAGFPKPEGFSSGHKGDNGYENEPSKHISQSP